MSTNVMNNIKCDINIDIKLEGKMVTCIFPSQDLSNDDDTDTIISDKVCVQVIYAHILDRLSPTHCNWFSRELHERVSTFLNSKIYDYDSGKSLRVHLRGLSYPHRSGVAISILHQYAKSILAKYLVDKDFVFQFDLEKAFSTDTSLLATVTSTSIMIYEKRISLIVLCLSTKKQKENDQPSKFRKSVTIYPMLVPLVPHFTGTRLERDPPSTSKMMILVLAHS
jgi:hypothetical protein